MDTPATQGAESHPTLPDTEGNFIYDDYTTSREGKDQRFLQLTRPEEHLLAEEVEFEVGHYYRLQAAGTDWVSSLLLVHPPDEPSPVLLTFWIAWNETRYDISEDGLRRNDGLDLPPDTRRCYLVVTPHNVWPEIRVSEARFMGRGKEGRLRIFFRCSTSLLGWIGCSDLYAHDWVFYLCIRCTVCLAIINGV